jgi:parallel beta-helix repeat protein
MKRFALAILIVAVAAALVLLVLNRPGATASPDVTITVNSTGDTNTRDNFLTLREAIMLATGDLTLADLLFSECEQVSGTLWGGAIGCFGPDPPGETSADTIVFDTSLFAPSSPATIALDPIISQALPALDTGNDTVDGSAAGVIVEGLGTAHENCFEITSSNNTIKGLNIYNCRIGVYAHSGAKDNTIGGSTQAERNVISDNDIGVDIEGGGAENNTVKGNYIGTNAAGAAAKANRIGVAVSTHARNNTVEDNLISGNTEAGVLILYSDANVVKGNHIGTNAAGGAPVPNGVGVDIGFVSQGNTIGGTALGEGNVIAFNTGDGVRVGDGGMPAAWDTIRGNSIHSNGGQGIHLVDGGNIELPPPAITGFGSVTGTACPNCIIDIYSDDEDEGRVYEGSTTADGGGDWSYPGWPEGPNATATATDADGNTSEFSAPVAVPEPTPSPTPEGSRTLDWDPGWHNATWTGDSTPEEAFACAAGDYAAAYRLAGGGWERYFPDRPELSNMTDLEQYDAFLILVTDDVTCEMPVADAPDDDRRLDWDVGWQNDGWTGADGTEPEDAFACADGSYAAAYRLVGGGWERYFPGSPGLSNMDELDQYDAFLILVTAPVSCRMTIAP